jgi:hypothetical protein
VQNTAQGFVTVSLFLTVTVSVSEVIFSCIGSLVRLFVPLQLRDVYVPYPAVVVPRAPVDVGGAHLWRLCRLRAPHLGPTQVGGDRTDRVRCEGRIQADRGEVQRHQQVPRSPIRQGRRPGGGRQGRRHGRLFLLPPHL